MGTPNEHILRGFADEMAKIAAKNKGKKAAVFDLMKDGQKTTGQKGKLGQMWRRGSFFGQQTDTPHDIAIPYDRDGANAQHGSFEAQSSDASRGQYYDQKV
jgi:hypothetical protein